MTYNNPQITKLDSAIKAIQRVDDKSDNKVTDTFPSDPLFPALITAPAYQADE